MSWLAAAALCIVRPEPRLNHPPAHPPACLLDAHQGVVKQPHFRRFRSETAQSEGGARKLLGDAGVGHYWELCEAFAAE